MPAASLDMGVEIVYRKDWARCGADRTVDRRLWPILKRGKLSVVTGWVMSTHIHAQKVNTHKGVGVYYLQCFHFLTIYHLQFLAPCSCYDHHKEILLGVPGWLSQLSIRLLISAQVMISRFVGSSPTLGSALTVWSPLGTLSLSLSLCLASPCLCCLCLLK